MSDSKSLSIFDNQGLTDVQTQICTLIASGRNIADACKLAGTTKYYYTKWLAELPAFECSVRRARAILVDQQVDEMDHVARHEPDVNRARLIVDSIKWRASKMIPKVYGDKLDVTVEHRLDIGEALAAARARATLRPQCDPIDVIDGEVVAAPSVEPPRAVDKQSTPQLPDIFD